MKMSPREAFALRDYLGPELKGRTISDARQVVSLTDILEETCLAGRLGELSGQSVLLAVADQLTSGIVMTELDGVAGRMLLCPPDLNAGHLQALMEDAGIDAVVTDQPARWGEAGTRLILTAGAPRRAAAKAQIERPTEWLMLTSGTSGVPKIVSHTLEGLTGAIVAIARRGPALRSGPPSTTFAATVAFRSSCAPSSAAVRWSCRSRESRLPITSTGCARRALPRFPARRRIGANF